MWCWPRRWSPASRRAHGRCRVVERLGPFGERANLSLISIHEHDIPDRFPQAALDQAEAARPVPRAAAPICAICRWSPSTARMRGISTMRSGPRRIPIRRIRAVIASVVAIADVAHYVTAGDALDREAHKRGNSVYFPDRVVPMLPEALSNGLCSLKPLQDRGCLAVEMIIDRDGNKRHHRFMRGLMRSAARLTYDQVQRRPGRRAGRTGRAAARHRDCAALRRL